MECKKCNSQINDGEKICPNCGFENDIILICPICKTPFDIGQTKCKKCLTPLPKTERIAPDEVKKFNFAAMFLSFFWGVTHKVYSPLVILIPVLGLVIFPFVSIYLGFKGSEIAWKKGSWKNISEFLEDNKIWNIVAWSLFAATIVLFIVTFSIMFAMHKPYIEKANNFFKVYNTEFKMKDIFSEVQIKKTPVGALKLYAGLHSIKQVLGDNTKYTFKNSKFETNNNVVRYTACYDVKYKNYPNKKVETCLDMLGSKTNKSAVSLIGVHVREK